MLCLFVYMVSIRQDWKNDQMCMTPRCYYDYLRLLVGGQLNSELLSIVKTHQGFWYMVLILLLVVSEMFWHMFSYHSPISFGQNILSLLIWGYIKLTPIHTKFFSSLVEFRKVSSLIFFQEYSLLQFDSVMTALGRLLFYFTVTHNDS